METERLTITVHDSNIYVLTMRKPPENRLNLSYAQELIRALRWVEAQIGDGKEGALIVRGQDEKFWCTGLELDESQTNPTANSDGFFPLLATLLDLNFPTIALLTGHTFGGGCPFALAHDYRVMNARRGFFSMPPVNLGLHFDGIGALPRQKLSPAVARRLLLEAHRWTSKEALADGIVDAVAEPGEMLERALELARSVRGRAKMGVFSLFRNELYGEAAAKIRALCYVHGKVTSLPPKAKL